MLTAKQSIPTVAIQPYVGWTMARLNRRAGADAGSPPAPGSMGTAFPATGTNVNKSSGVKNHRFGGLSDPKDGLQRGWIRVPLFPSRAWANETPDVIRASRRVNRAKLSDA